MKSYKEIAEGLRRVERSMDAVVESLINDGEDYVDAESLCTRIGDLALAFETGVFEDFEVQEALDILEDWDVE